MRNIKIPQKSFDEQMHIIRDVHFDIDKYKVGELYVINNTLEGIVDNDDIKTFQGGKVIGQLVKANRDSLIFEVPVYFKDPNTGGIYSFEDVTLSIDTIINYRIEIERLLTETEATVYLMSAISKECAKDIIPEPISRNPVLDEVKQSTFDPKDPKFNRLLGIVPDHSQFPYTLERTHSYQELQAAYKINTPEEAEEIAKDSQMNIVNDIIKNAEDEKKNYVVWLVNGLTGYTKSFPIIDSEGNFDPTPFKGLATGSGRVRVKLVKGSSVVQFTVHSKYIKATSDAIIITGNKSKSSIFMTLMRDNFREMFDKIEFDQIL